MKKREELDMTAIVDATITAFHESKGSPGGPLDALSKNRLAAALMPVIWHSTQAVLDQLAAGEAADSLQAEDDAVAAITIPDSLEGLDGFEGLASA